MKLNGSQTASLLYTHVCHYHCKIFMIHEITSLLRAMAQDLF